MIEGCVAMSALTTSVGPTIPEFVEYWSCAEFFVKSSVINSFWLVMRPTVTMPNVPSFELMMSGCGSVSLMTPMPTGPSKRATSCSNLERNGEFWML